MVLCAVYGCRNRSGRDSVSYFRFPKPSTKYSEKTNALVFKRLRLWVIRLGRKDFNEMKASYNRICGNHFISGTPAKLQDTTNPDWAPCINLGHDFFEPPVIPQKIRNDDISRDTNEDSSHEKDTDENVESLNFETSDTESDKNSRDKIKVFVFGPSKPESQKKDAAVTHDEALVSAQTLFRYILIEADVDKSFVTSLMDYMLKVREKIIREEY